MPITADQIKQFTSKMFDGQPQNPLYPQPPAVDPSQPTPPQNSAPPAGTSPQGASPDSSTLPSLQQPRDAKSLLFGVPASGSSSTAAPASPPTGSAGSTPGSSVLGGSQPPSGASPSSSPVLTADQFGQQNPDAYKAYLPARPTSDFDPNTPHPTLRHALSALFAGMAEFGRPGQGAAMVNRWNQQNENERDYDANLPKLKSGAIAQAFNQYLSQQAQGAEIGKTGAETGLINAQAGNLAMNPPGKAEFLKDAQDRIKSGQEDPQGLYQELLARAPYSHTTRDEITNLFNATKEMPPNPKIGPQGIAESVTYHSKAYARPDPKAPADPNMPDVVRQAFAAQAPVESTIHQNKLQEQGATRSNIQMQNDLQVKTKNLETGQKNSQESFSAIHDATNQQKLIEDLAADPGNDLKQQALLLQMAGAERPGGQKRVPPQAIEELKETGGLSERVSRQLMNWKEGDVLPRAAIPELVEAAKTINDSKIKTANDDLQSNFETYGYKHPGTGPHGRLDETQQQQPAGGQGGPAQPKGATHTGVGSADKKKHWLDAQGNDLGLAE